MKRNTKNHITIGSTTTTKNMPKGKNGRTRTSSVRNAEQLRNRATSTLRSDVRRATPEEHRTMERPNYRAERTDNNKTNPKPSTK